MKINAYVKNRGPLVTSKPLPSSPPLQRGRGLANHPLSCHPQRSVWQPRKGEKMREKKENGRTGALILFTAKNVSLNSVYKWLI